MLWILFIVICVIAVIIGFNLPLNYYQELKDNAIILVTLGTISGIVSLFCFIGNFSSGITDYPWFFAKKAEIVSYEKRIVDIKNARYKIKGGEFVGGSLDNMKQSTNLSDYIANVAKLEAEYNKYLADCKISKHTTIFRLLGRGYFISDEVDKLEPL